MSSFIVTTLLISSAQLPWVNHPLRMSGPDSSTHVRLGGGQGGAAAAPRGALTFLHNLLEYSGEGLFDERVIFHSYMPAL